MLRCVAYSSIPGGSILSETSVQVDVAEGSHTATQAALTSNIPGYEQWAAQIKQYYTA